MKKMISLLLGALSLSLCSYALADGPNIKPGLWQYKVNVSSQSGRMEKAMEQAKAMMASLPPEQRAMMESMMASKGGMKSFSDQNYELCMTEQDIKQVNLPNPDEQCQQKLIEQSPNQYKLTLRCSGNPPMNGDGKFVIENPKKFTGKIVMTMPIEGVEDTLTMLQQGTWISAKCEK